MEIVPVPQLHKQCSLPLRKDWLALSDCCLLPATSAVRDEHGRYYWRCERHRGVSTLFPHTLGAVFDSVPVRP